MKKFWHFLTKPSSRYSVLAIAIVFILITLAGVFTFHETIEFTSTNEFCTSCHSMKQNYIEYKTSLHYKNAYGVRAECRDCHIPENNPIDFMKAKMGGLGDIYSEFVSKDIDTPAKFEANRLRMAEDVWKMMKATNSAPCKSCHAYSAMDHAKQSPAAAAAMTPAAAKDMNCIECHKGIVHQLPHMKNGFQAEFTQLSASAETAPRANNLYAITSKQLFAAKGSSSAQGQLFPASEVKVLDRQGDELQIQISGWAQQGPTANMLMQEMGKKIVVAALEPELQKTQKVIATETAKDGAKWDHVEVTAWIAQKGMIATLKPLWTYAENMYQDSCSQCHAAPKPSHLTANEWIGSLNSMRQYFILNKNEERVLLKYLQLHAKDSGQAAQTATK